MKWFSKGNRNDIWDCTKIMIVAHPDDETLWGGMTLALDPRWCVVCLTHASDKSRAKAFRRAMSQFNVSAEIFDIPDRKEHSPYPEDLDLLTGIVYGLVTRENVTDVMTHGPDGEYGHPFHIAVCEAVTEFCPDDKRLWYFNFDQAVNHTLDDPTSWQKKQEAIKVYLGEPSGWAPTDSCHVELGRHEKPTLSSDYIRPKNLISATYASSGMEIR